MNKAIMTAALALFAGLAACTAFELRDANSQLTELYIAALNDDPLVRSNARRALATLADDAGSAAASGGVAANQISFYRVAATAAWQAREFSAANDYAEEGMQLCETNAASVPRDCAMLAIIPSLAAVDELTLEVDRHPGTSRLLVIFGLYGSRADDLIEARQRIAGGQADPDLVAELDERIGQLVCNNMNQAILGSLTGDVSERRCEIKSRLDAADQAGIDVSNVALFQTSCASLQTVAC